MRGIYFSRLWKKHLKKNVAEVMKVEILFNLLGKRAGLVYVNAEDMKDYYKIKSIILKEF